MRKIRYPFYNQDEGIDEVKLDIFKNEYLQLFSENFKCEIDKISKKIKSNLDHQKILSSPFIELMNLAKEFNSNCHNWNSLNELFKTESGFKYDSKRERILDFIVNQKIKINSCHYCNIDFINSFEADDKNYDHSTFDHVLPKKIFPFLSLSVFNLVPCCYSCNSKFKKETEFKIDDNLPKIIPSAIEFQLNDILEFQLKFKSSTKEIKADLTNISRTENVDQFMKIFKLKNRYDFHIKKAEDLIEKRKIYSDSQIKEIAKLLNRDIQSIKKDIFGKECFESTNAPFEKYKQDVAKQLGLIK